MKPISSIRRCFSYNGNVVTSVRKTDGATFVLCVPRGIERTMQRIVSPCGSADTPSVTMCEACFTPSRSLPRLRNGAKRLRYRDSSIYEAFIYVLLTDDSFYQDVNGF